MAPRNRLTANTVSEAGPNPEPEQHRGDRHDGAGVEDRSCLAGDDLDQRRTRRGLKVAARIDKIDNRDLDRVAPLPVEPSG